jgi:hypothetical protein
MEDSDTRSSRMPDLPEAELQETMKSDPCVSELLKGKQSLKEVIVQRRLVNFVLRH